MDFTYSRTVYLADTDAAGVVYFARGLAICHEAYEEWLGFSGVSLSKLLQEKEIALPIVHGEIDFFRPIFCGDTLKITLEPKLINDTEFEIAYQIFLPTSPTKASVKALTNHVCINPLTRIRVPLPSAIFESLS